MPPSEKLNGPVNLDTEGFSLFQLDPEGVVASIDVDMQTTAMPPNSEAKRLPRCWEPRVEANPRAREAQPSEAENDRLPESTERPNVDAVGSIAEGVLQVDGGCLGEVAGR